VFVLAVAGLFAYSYYRIHTLSNELIALRADIASTTALTNESLHTLALNIADLGEETTGLSDVLNATRQNVATVESQVGGVSQTVGQISSTVGTLEKLSKTDPELLQKYSKVFFLNEHYAPERVIEIPKANLYIESEPELIHASVWPYLNTLFTAAKQDGITIYVRSAYRSFDEQHHLKAAYRVTYGEGTANQFSADQGYSEHQLGTTIDIITTGLGGQLEGFDTTAAYTWLQNNAHKYGFTLSYPENNSYYIFEPWHWRFVGVGLATDLHNQGKHFYDLDQRDIDEYLVNIFD